MRFRFTTAANREIRSALGYYEDQEEGLGLKFLDELEATISRVVAMPEAWKPLSTRTRRCLFHRFPYGVIYQIRGEEILVVAVMDLRRDPVSYKDLL
jgi:plasmid stabilization system protein ParE